MTKLSTLLIAVSLLTLAPQMAQGSANNNEMPGLESESKGTPGSVPAKYQPIKEDELDQQIAAEEAHKKELEQEEKRKKLEALKAKNAKKEQELTVGQKVGRETDRVFDQAAKQTERLTKHLRKKKF